MLRTLTTVPQSKNPNFQNSQIGNPNPSSPSMDFNLKQWRVDSDAQNPHSAAKLPGLDLLALHPPPASASSALPLFVPESTTTKFPISGMASCYFSSSQWQELEIQALIFRHMTTGDPVPPELLQLVKKSLLDSPNFYTHHYHSPLVPSGYWGRAAMDPEPGRCRRTDGKKWRCSRDVVAGQKYCERHMHRGRNRSRKPVELHAATSAACPNGGATSKSVHSASTGGTLAAGGSVELLNFNPRGGEGALFEAQKEAQPNSRMLRHFFDDWPRQGDEAETNLSISMPGKASNDFSLKLGYGNGDSDQRDKSQVNWGMGWESNPGLAMGGGPLAEALRSSMCSSSSPTSVLHEMVPRGGGRGGQASEGSYGST